jgi:MFS family permease
MAGHRPVATARPRPGRLWFRFVLVHAVLLQAMVFVHRPMTSYRAIELGVPIVGLGLLSSTFALVPLLLAIPSGRATDRIGERPVMLAGAAVMVVAAATFLVLGDSIAGLAFANITLGTGQLLSVVGEQAMLANRTGRHGYDSAFGRYTFAAALGQTAGPALLVLLGGSGRYPDGGTVFGAALVIAGALAASTISIGRDPAGAVTAASRPVATIGSVLRLPGLVRALVASSVVLSAVDVLTVYLPALGVEFGISAAVVGVLLAIRSGTSMLSRLFLGNLARLLGRQRLLLGSIVGSAVAVLALVVPAPVPVLAVAVAAAGFALGIGQPLTMSWLAEVSPPGLRGTVMALRLTGNRLGQTVVPTSVGLVAATTGVGGVMAVTAAALLAAGVAVRHVSVDSPARPSHDPGPRSRRR